MKKILAFGASSSRKSINRQLAKFVVSQIGEAETHFLDLNDFEMPIFSVDKEREEGIPQKAIKFKEYIKSSDAIVISFAEHNGSYSAAFKNIFDWASRVEKGMWQDKPMFLLATSPGARGGKSVLDLAVGDFPYRNGNVIASFSLPSFMQNFSIADGIINVELNEIFKKQLSVFKKALFD